jgi:glycine cleavage system aminomethyltransferase T
MIMRVDTRNRYTEEERAMILSNMMDLPVDRLGAKEIDKEKLVWLKLKKIHDDISDRAQITATQHRWFAFFALILAGLSSSLPQIGDLLSGEASLGEVWSGFLSPAVGFAVALYIVLRPLHIEKKGFEPSLRA